RRLRAVAATRRNYHPEWRLSASSGVCSAEFYFLSSVFSTFPCSVAPTVDTARRLSFRVQIDVPPSFRGRLERAGNRRSGGQSLPAPLRETETGTGPSRIRPLFEVRYFYPYPRSYRSKSPQF